ncbi:hypothetical protein [Halobacterium litoreum]|uniref:Uncharacterized protein n=1 Tax=Halobacterium litoreum TaxID=2039234 RepID=A0ABD5NDR7_9EURY|nr:hypothetical protein [Halobacterium litoreum]
MRAHSDDDAGRSESAVRALRVLKLLLTVLVLALTLARALAGGPL